MGLLSKALETGNSDGGLLKRAVELRGSAASANTRSQVSKKKSQSNPNQSATGDSFAGDLRSAAAARSGAVAPPATQPSHEPPENAEQAVRAILAGIQKLAGGLQSPAQLFGLLAENLDLQRAAILLPDYDDGTFVPWASLGFDATTLQRMRIAKEDIAALRERGGAGVVWRGAAIKRFAPYFSHREGTMLEQLLILPFAAEEQTHAVILIADSPYLSNREEILRLVLAAVGQAAAELIGDERHARVRVLGHAVTFKRDEIGVIIDRVVSRTEQAPTIFLTDLSDVVSQIATANRYTDSFRVWQDVLRGVATLFASSASVCDAGSSRALALIHSSTSEDYDLIAQQIGATLWQLFPELGGTIPPRYTVRHPESADDTAEVAFSLL